VSVVDKIIHPFFEFIFQFGVDDVNQILPWKSHDFLLSIRETHHYERIVCSKFNEPFHCQKFVLWNVKMLNILSFDVAFLSCSKVLQMKHIHKIRVRQINSPFVAKKVVAFGLVLCFCSQFRCSDSNFLIN
jgi:hypothetical protein